MLSIRPGHRALCLIVAIACAPGVALARPAPPAAVLAILGEDAVGEDAPRFARADVTPDGMADWVANFSDRLAWCGSGGCRQMVIISQVGGGYAVAFDEQTREFRLRHRKGQATLDVEIYGAWCGGAGVTDCRRRFRWSNIQQRFTEVPNGRGDTRLHGPLFQVVPAVAPAGLAPGPCESRPASIPDLDGDGRRDLVIQTGPCEGQDGALSRLWVSGRASEFAAAWPGDDYVVDIRATPAQLFVAASGCVAPAPCDPVARVWNKTSGLFEAAAP